MYDSGFIFMNICICGVVCAFMCTHDDPYCGQRLLPSRDRRNGSNLLWQVTFDSVPSTKRVPLQETKRQLDNYARELR